VANTPPGLTLAISVSAVLPSTVSATASSGGRFAIAVSSSVATAWSAPAALASSTCPSKTPAITVAPRSLAVNTAERPTFPTAPATKTVWPALIPVAERSLLARYRHERQRRRLDQIEPLGDLHQDPTDDTKVSVTIVCHREDLVADGKPFHLRPDLHDGSRHIDPYETREMDRIIIVR
jgi:hypothetical protein